MNINQLDSLNIKYVLNEPLKNWTTFKVGGPCKAMFFPKNKEELFTLSELFKDEFFVTVALIRL